MSAMRMTLRPKSAVPRRRDEPDVPAALRRKYQIQPHGRSDHRDRIHESEDEKQLRPQIGSSSG